MGDHDIQRPSAESLREGDSRRAQFFKRKDELYKGVIGAVWEFIQSLPPDKLAEYTALCHELNITVGGPEENRKLGLIWNPDSEEIYNRAI